MAFCAINMSVENRRDFGAIAMLLHMILAGAGAILVCCYFVIRNLLDELNGLLRKHYSKTTLYLESVLVIGLLMILIHGYGVKVRVAMWSRSVSTSRSRRLGLDPLRLRSRLGRIVKRLGLGIEGLCLGIGLRQLGFANIPGGSLAAEM